MNTGGFISRITLRLPMDPPGGTSREYLRHQAVMSLFTGDDDAARPLFRLMTSGSETEQLLVVSSGVPVATPSIEPGTWVARVESKPFAPQLSTQQALDFSIAVNATGVVTQSDGRKLRQDIWDIVFAGDPGPEVDRDDVYTAWLVRQLDGVADVNAVRVVSRGLVRVRRTPRAAPISYVQTELVGSLVVRDPEALQRRLVDGIGRARAFGCGLLCLMAHGSLQRR